MVGSMSKAVATVVNGPVTINVTGSEARCKVSTINCCPVWETKGVLMVFSWLRMGKLSIIKESRRYKAGKGLIPLTVLSATGIGSHPIKSSSFLVTFKAALI